MHESVFDEKLQGRLKNTVFDYFYFFGGTRCSGHANLFYLNGVNLTPFIFIVNQIFIVKDYFRNMERVGALNIRLSMFPERPLSLHFRNTCPHFRQVLSGKYFGNLYPQIAHSLTAISKPHETLIYHSSADIIFSQICITGNR